ncbi:MAG TPA: DUF3025 domain-containing protein [Polyangiaceae bacterium]
MRPLVAVRQAVAAEPGFFGPTLARALEHEPLFFPVAAAGRALASFDDFPPVDALGCVFPGAPAVRFVPATPRRRRRAEVDARALYDARIALDGEVPTRERSLHDLMNALVWATFPRAKRALHARQHRAIVERLAPGTRRLPPTRTPELDALALLDEGGVVLTDRSTPPVVFGHAIYESLLLGYRPSVVAAIALRVDAPDSAGGIEAIDRSLADAIEDPARLRAPSEFKRVAVAPSTLPKSAG